MLALFPRSLLSQSRCLCAIARGRKTRKMMGPQLASLQTISITFTSPKYFSSSSSSSSPLPPSSNSSSPPSPKPPAHDPSLLFLHVAPGGDWWIAPDLFAAKHLQSGYVRSVPLGQSEVLDIDFVNEFVQELSLADILRLYDTGEVPEQLRKLLPNHSK